MFRVIYYIIRNIQLTYQVQNFKFSNSVLISPPVLILDQNEAFSLEDKSQTPFTVQFSNIGGVKCDSL